MDQTKSEEKKNLDPKPKTLYQKLNDSYKKLNTLLITKYPFWWKTQFHLLLLYCIIFSILTFLVGYFSPVTFKALCTETEKIVQYKNILSILFICTSILFVLFWRKRIVQYQVREFRWGSSLLEAAIYFIGILLLWVASNMFYVGISTRIAYTTLKMTPQEQTVLAKYNYLLPKYYVHNDSTKIRNIGRYFDNGDKLVKYVLDQALYKKEPYLRMKMGYDSLNYYPFAEYFGLRYDLAYDKYYKDVETLISINNFDTVNSTLKNHLQDIEKGASYSFKTIIPVRQYRNLSTIESKVGFVKLDYNKNIKLLERNQTYLPDLLINDYLKNIVLDKIFISRLNFIEALSYAEFKKYTYILGVAMSKTTKNPISTELFVLSKLDSNRVYKAKNLYNSYEKVRAGIEFMGPLSHIDSIILKKAIGVDLFGLYKIARKGITRDSLYCTKLYNDFFNLVNNEASIWHQEYIKYCNIYLNVFNASNEFLNIHDDYFHKENIFYLNSRSSKIIDSLINRDMDMLWVDRIKIGRTEYLDSLISSKQGKIDNILIHQLRRFENTSEFRELQQLVDPYQELYLIDRENYTIFTLPNEIFNYLRSPLFKNLKIGEYSNKNLFKKKWMDFVYSAHYRNNSLFRYLRPESQLRLIKTLRNRNIATDSINLFNNLNRLALILEKRVKAKHMKELTAAIDSVALYESDFFGGLQKELINVLDYSTYLNIKKINSIYNHIDDEIDMLHSEFMLSSLYQKNKNEKITDSEIHQITHFLQKNKIVSDTAQHDPTTQWRYARYYGADLLKGVFEVQKAKNYLRHFFTTDVFQRYILALLVFATAIFFFTLSFETRIITAAFSMAFLLIILTNLFSDRYKGTENAVQNFMELGLTTGQILIFSIVLISLFTSMITLLFSQRRMWVPGFLLNMVVVFAVTLLTTEPELYYGSGVQPVEVLEGIGLVPKAQAGHIDQLDLYFYLTAYLGTAILFGSILVKRNHCLPEKRN